MHTPLITRSSAATDTASPVITIAPGTSGSPAFAWKRLALIALLVTEILYLTVSFDTQSLERSASVWTLVAGWSPQYLRIAIAACGALALLVVTGLAAPRWMHGLAAARVSGAWLLVHLAAFASFIWLTRRFLTSGDSVAAYPGVWTMTWAVAGAAMIASWAGAVFPQRRWWSTAVENRAVMAMSLAAGTAIWAASFVTESLWTPLARFTFNVVASILGLVYAQTVSRPEQLIVGTPHFKVFISPECSGYEGIGLILAFLTIYLFVLRRELRFPGALILLPIGVAAMWVLNVGRIVALIAIGTSGWPAIAKGGFHSQAGWLAFNAVALGFVALTNYAGYFRRRSEPADDLAAAARPQATAVTTDSTIASLAPFVALLGVAMITGAFSAGFDWLYGIRIAIAAALLWSYRAAYRRFTWTFSWQACAIGVVTAVMWVTTFPLTVPHESAWPASLHSASGVAAAVYLAIKFVGYVVIVPLAEELAFRVYALRRLVHDTVDAVPVGTFSVASFAISSLLFGALHGSLWMQGTIAGMAFAGALYRRRSVGDAVLAHATTNALIAIYVFSTGRWSVWS